ncbi:hypothetical protein FQN54_001993 [Arachnomyces sp. PD_36]|nr:hypothetical protein FQN54_001993 [Arachnomyces sp. PD_36]
MMALFTSLHSPVTSSRRISAISDTAFQTFSNQSDYFFGSLRTAPPAQSTGCPNPAAILSSLEGKRSSLDAGSAKTNSNLWRISSKFASLSRSLIPNRLPSFRNLPPDSLHLKQPSSPKPHAQQQKHTSSPNDTAKTTPIQQGPATIPKNTLDVPFTTQSPPEQQSRPGSTLYKYQQPSDFAHVPVTSGRKELRGSCLGLIVGLVACIMWF